MLSGNKYMSRSSLGSTIYQGLQQIPKEDYLSEPNSSGFLDICLEEKLDIQMNRQAQRNVPSPFL